MLTRGCLVPNPRFALGLHIAPPSENLLSSSCVELQRLPKEMWSCKAGKTGERKIKIWQEANHSSKPNSRKDNPPHSVVRENHWDSCLTAGFANAGFGWSTAAPSFTGWQCCCGAYMYHTVIYPHRQTGWMVCSIGLRGVGCSLTTHCLPRYGPIEAMGDVAPEPAPCPSFSPVLLS